MISTLIANSWKALSRDRGAQVLAFVVPIAFFSIFAVIFGGSGGNSMTTMSRVRVAIVDESNTARSRELIAALEADSSLRLITTAVPAGAPSGGAQSLLTRARASELVKAGDLPTALILPAGIDTSMMRFDGQGVKVQVLRDPSDPVSSRVAVGMLQRAALRISGIASSLGMGAAGDASPKGAGGTQSSEAALLPILVEEQTVLGEKRDNPMVAFYAAGIAVMFIMFSAAAAGGAFIEENESGTLERVLSSGLGMNGMLLAKWLYVTSLACMQVTVMFVWGMFVFKLPLLSHLPGFAVMTLFTGAAAAAFGLVIATIARTRQQLSGLANLLVLSMNALGGSMFPRFLMSESLQKMSLVGFNAWALDGYLKVFWREQPLTALAPQVGALAGFTVLFLFIARRLASRWETA